jgi:hypothetical protein
MKIIHYNGILQQKLISRWAFLSCPLKLVLGRPKKDG